jgi:hypothetical protein
LRNPIAMALNEAAMISQKPGFPGGQVEAMSNRNSHRLPAI